MGKEAFCTICDTGGHYPYQCWKKRKNPIKTTKRLKASGKHHRLWQATKKRWFAKNTKPVYRCYICGKLVDRANLTLDHVLPRGSHPELRYELSNLKPVHGFCNVIKGSRRAEDVVGTHN